MYIKEIVARGLNLPNPWWVLSLKDVFSLIGRGPSECQSQSD